MKQGGGLRSRRRVWGLGRGSGIRRWSGRLGRLGLITSSGSRRSRARLVVGGSVELRLVACSGFWRLRLVAGLRPVSFLCAGADHLRRVFVVVRVHPKPFWWRLFAVFVSLRNEDTRVDELGDRRSALDEVALHGCQLRLGLGSERGQLVQTQVWIPRHDELQGTTRPSACRGALPSLQTAYCDLQPVGSPTGSAQ